MGIKDRKHINSEDSALFRDSIGDVRPINTRPRTEQTAKPTAKALQRRRDERQALQESLHRSGDDVPAELIEDSSFKRNSVSRKRMRELRAGKIAIRDELDLHGCTRKEAKPLLHSFIHESARFGLSCVRIVHGKGMRSGATGPVLKNAVNQWLRNWETVQAFCPARNCDGGTGALYVLLTKTDK